MNATPPQHGPCAYEVGTQLKGVRGHIEALQNYLYEHSGGHVSARTMQTAMHLLSQLSTLAMMTLEGQELMREECNSLSRQLTQESARCEQLQQELAQKKAQLATAQQRNQQLFASQQTNRGTESASGASSGAKQLDLHLTQ